MLSRYLNRRLLVGFAIVALMFGLAGPASAQVGQRGSTNYYMIMFAVQSEPNVARLSHTFAAFVRAAGPEANPSAQLDVQTISWMPRSLEIEPLRMFPTQGVNLNLAETLSWARSVDSRVTMWGPYPIEKELYDVAAHRSEQLKSGAIQYIANDRRRREEGAVNCIHALSDMIPSQSLLGTGSECGNGASELVLQHLNRYVSTSSESADWLTQRLKLDSPLVHQAAATRAMAQR